MLKILCATIAIIFAFAVPCPDDFFQDSVGNHHGCSASSADDEVSLMQMRMRSSPSAKKPNRTAPPASNQTKFTPLFVAKEKPNKTGFEPIPSQTAEKPKSNNHTLATGQGITHDNCKDSTLANQTLAHAWLQNAKYGREHTKLFTRELRMLQDTIRSWVETQPVPETPADEHFFVHLYISDLAKAQEKLRKVELLLAADKDASPSTARALEFLVSYDKWIPQHLNVNSCDLHKWVSEVNGTIDKFGTMQDEIDAAATILKQSSWRKDKEGQTIVTNKRDWHEGVATLPRMSIGIKVGRFGFVRLLKDAEVLES